MLGNLQQGISDVQPKICNHCMVGNKVLVTRGKRRMTGRLMACIGVDGEFASDTASRVAACKWVAALIREGKRWSEARGELAAYYRMSGLENAEAHAKSKGAKDLVKPWLQKLPTKKA